MEEPKTTDEVQKPVEESVIHNPTPASVSLPPTFVNSFWTADYRTGYESLYAQLERGLFESKEILLFIQNRATAERIMGNALIPSNLDPEGFGLDEGSSLKMGFEQLLNSSLSESRNRNKLAQELTGTIINPFSQWSIEHQGRIQSSETVVKSHLLSYEKKLLEVTKLKLHYDSACQNADVMEDEIAFAKGNSEREVVKVVEKEQPLEPVDDTEDENDGMIGRSGSTGSITAALGRALSVRRASNLAAKELPSAPQALDWSKNTFNSLFERVTGPQTNEGRNEKARNDAEIAEERYKDGVETLDQLRLILEESLFEHYHYTFKCENDRLKAAASVLKSFQAAVSNVPKSLITSNERLLATLQLVRPEKDVLALIEKSRTGPFQPRPTIYHSHYSEPAIKNFGLDLRKWEETNQSLDTKVPSILTFLLEYITESYKKLSDSDRRKSWLYETPLAAQHHLRSALNNPNHLDPKILEKYDLPVIVSTLKLWLLELDVPVILFSHYEEYRTLYPKRVGAEVVEVPAKNIAAYISRLPSPHYETLRLLICHFVELLKNSKTDESDEVYLQKLSLAFARCIIRPKQDTALTLDDRFPGLLFIDLVKSYEEVFADADLLRSKQREDRYKPRRQRTKIIDSRLSRSSIGVDENSLLDINKGERLLKEQRNSINISSPLPDIPSPSTSKLPPLPPSSTTTSDVTSDLPPIPATSSSSVSPEVKTISPSSSINSLSPKPRVTRGPRPLPSNPSEITTSSPSIHASQEVDGETKADEVTE